LLSETQIERVAECQPLRELFVWEGVDFWLSIWPRLRKLFGDYLKEILEKTILANEACLKLQPDALLLSMAANAMPKAVCHVFRKYQTPSFVSKHGEMGVKETTVDAFQDVAGVDVSLCWSLWEQGLIQQFARTYHYEPGQMQTLVVGSPFMEDLLTRCLPRKKIRSLLGYSAEEKVVLYLPISLNGNEWYLSYYSLSDVGYFNQGRQLLEQLLALDGWSVLLKEKFNGTSPLADWVGVRNEARLRVIQEPSFRELIHLADVLVFDCPSTTLIQGLMGKARIYIVDHPIFRWRPGVRAHLEKIGVHFCTLQTLKTTIRADEARGCCRHLKSRTWEDLRPMFEFSPEESAARRGVRLMETFLDERKKKMRSSSF